MLNNARESQLLIFEAVSSSETIPEKEDVFRVFLEQGRSCILGRFVAFLICLVRRATAGRYQKYAENNLPFQKHRYMASATTSSTSGTIRLSNPSIPALSVIIDEGQPLHEPRSSTSTLPSSNAT